MRTTIQQAIQQNRLGRRGFLRLAGGTAAGLSLGPWGWSGRAVAQTPTSGRAGFGPLVPDPQGRLALPRGFQYRELSKEGASLKDGTVIPGAHDGMAAFPGPRGTVVLVRNHEMAFLGGDNPQVTPSSAAATPTAPSSGAARRRSSSAPTGRSWKPSSPPPAPPRTAPAAPPRGALG